MLSHKPLIRAAAAGMAILVMAGPSPAESAHVFGIHTWDWGADLDVMSFKPGWVVEAMLASASPNVWGRYVPMRAEGFTIIERLDYSWDFTIPPDPGLYGQFAYNCAHNWARNLKRYCRHYLIGNEIDFDFTPEQYVPCFEQARDAIKAEQPNARVIVGHWNSGGNLRRTLQLLGPDGYDGITCHTGSTVPTDMLNMLDEEGARPGVGVYITEWGWVAGTNPNAQAVMLQFCQSIAAWNAAHDRQVYSACWYAYPNWFHTVFSLEASPIDNAAFENMTANCTATNSYAANPITVSNTRVEVSSVNEALQVRWHTDVPSTSQIWFWNQVNNNGEFRPTEALKDVFWNRVVDHQVTMSGPPHVQAQTEYLLVCRSGEDDCGEGDSGYQKVTSGPWTVSVGNISETTATVSWTTLFNSTSRVEYGQTTAYGSQETGTGGVTSHQVALQDLQPSTQYHYRVWSEAEGYFPHHSADAVFQTLAPSGPYIQVSPLQIRRTAMIQEEGPVPTDYLSIRNGGSGTITYALAPGCSWLDVQPANGTSTGETDLMELSYNDTGVLGLGEHSCTITISAPEAYNSPVDVLLTLVLSTVAPDFDGDGDVDQEDFGHFQVCMTGAGMAQQDPGCADTLLDPDSDVDLDDFAVLVGCLSGPGSFPPPDCAE